MHGVGAYVLMVRFVKYGEAERHIVELVLVPCKINRNQDRIGCK